MSTFERKTAGRGAMFFLIGMTLFMIGCAGVMADDIYTDGYGSVGNRIFLYFLILGASLTALLACRYILKRRKSGEE